ncbi:MAG: PAS domain S-box protein [Methanoregula sp.]|nr:PAS domain S-box protein [Methanoregula sp.]
MSIANAEFERLSEYSREEIEGKKSWTEFVVKEDLDRMLAQHQLRRERQETVLKHYEFRFITRSGTIRKIFLTIDMIPGTKRSVASLMDITDRIRAQ